MRSINPTFKFIGIFAPAILLAFFYRPMLNFAVFAVCMVVVFLSKAKIRSVLLLLIPVLLVAIGMFFTGYYFGSDVTTGMEDLYFTDEAVYNGLQLSSRILAFFGLGALFVFTTDKMEFVRSLMQQLRLSPTFAYGVLAAFGIFPNMKQEYGKTRAAFYARGIFPGLVSPRLLRPLLVKSVRWSEALAAAMESKGFSEREERSRYYNVTVRAYDWVFVFLTSGLLIPGLLFL